HISDEIMVMYLGQCVEKTTSNELFQNPLHPYTKALLEAILIPSLECRKKRREIIEGEVASPINLKPACRFAQRCKYVKAECTTNDIELVEVSEGHSVRCILYN
ncbi:MAG TPA: ABC transporter ATP-binding protein, partial [Tissierellia bacterium]|nr:ABC transporter ATP-binding protein [Tissierellia bacterium]